MVDILCVDPCRAHEVWPHVEHLIKKAFDTGIGDDDLAGTRDAILHGRALLWLAARGNDILGAVTTKIINVSARKICVLVACGGRRFIEWKHIVSEIERYAETEGCSVVRISGRAGWKRIFPDYSEPFITLEKKIGLH